MGSSQSLPSFIFPEMSENDLKMFVNSLNSASKEHLELKYERNLGKGRVSWSMLVRNGKSLLLMRLYAKKGTSKQSVSRRRSNPSISSMDPLSATKLSFIHELYYEKCVQFDFVMKPLLINDSEDFLVVIRPFARYNLPDRLITESLGFQDKLWIGLQIIESFIKLHSLRACHGDFGTGKVFLTSQNKVILGDFAPIKPFCLQNRNQKPIEFYQIWFDEGLDGELREIGRGCYLAPERLKFNQPESFESADLFSLGCVLAEMFGARGFLQFKDTLKLSSFESDDKYNIFIDSCIENCEIPSENSFVIPLIKRLCARDPTMRQLTIEDLTPFKKRICEKVQNWRDSIISYRSTDDYYEKKNLITKNLALNLESLLLLIFREKDPILAALLVNRLEKDDFDYNELWSTDIFTFNPFMKQFNEIILKGNRDVLLQQSSDLKEVLRVLQYQNMTKDRHRSVLNKLLQIYRARETYDNDFELQMAFEYERIGTDTDDLFKTCWKLDLNVKPATLTRIAFQLDLEKNKVPIEKLSINVNSKLILKDNQLSHPRLKQRMLTSASISMLELPVLGVLQSPDKSFIICYTNSTIYFWDLKQLIRSEELLASVNPRSDAIITSVIFGTSSSEAGGTSLIISFKDGIIGVYKVVIKGNNVDFSIKESFGPFEDENLKLIFTVTRNSRRRALLLIGSRRIYGIDPENGEILFEFPLTFELKLFEMIEGCLLCVDSKGILRLIEIYYETGEVLSSWQLTCEQKDIYLYFEAFSITNSNELCVKLTFKNIGKVILVFKFDPSSEIVPCIFKHWILYSDKCDDNNLPIIKCVKIIKEDNHNTFTLTVVNNANIIALSEEVVEISDGILRLIDFTQISAKNSTSILFPYSNTYKPTLKLRNKRGKVPEIIENCGVASFDKKSYSFLIQKCFTFDGKNVLIVSVIGNKMILYC